MRAGMIAARGTAEWLERMRSARVLEVAVELGHRAKPARGASGGAVEGCPSCAAPRRHTKSGDKRGAVGIEPSGHGWRCFQCDASGDALDFVAFALGGDRLARLAETRKAEVRAWCTRWLGLDGAPRVQRKPLPPAEAPEKPAPSYVPDLELEAFWGACTRTDSDDQVATWLRSRCIDPTMVADLDLARVAPRSVPRWGGFGGDDGKPWRAWPSVGLRLVVPLYDHQGVMRSVVFRRSFETEATWPLKSVSARGGRVGLAMACPLARRVLAEGRPAQRLIVGEGEMDFLTYATEYSDADETAPATLGGFAGSWSLLEHVPAGSVLVVQTHDDRDGQKYANEIVGAVLARWRAGEIKVRLPAYFDLAGEKVELRT